MEIGVTDNHRRFVWYELMTTDVAGARDFYASVLAWDTRDASTRGLAYALFSSNDVEIAGLMALPQEATRKGATPRWLGYVGVDNVDKVTSELKRSGGTIYVPPTDTNIGRIAVVADPEMATLALINKVQPGAYDEAALDQPGHVGWHELFAIDPNKAFAFYQELFGWQNADSEIVETRSYRLFSVGGDAVGGMFARREGKPGSFWLYYFNVDDIDEATQRVKNNGGQTFEGPVQVPGDTWVARCIDPQGAMFALQGARSRSRHPQGSGIQVSWSSNWGRVSSRGRVIVDDGKGHSSN